MFEHYHSSMKQLKKIYHALEDSEITDINFLSTVQNSIKYIESTWNSFPNEYQQMIEEEYVRNIIQEMVSAIDAYTKNVKDFELFDDTTFRQTCEVVGNRLKFYTGRKNRATSKPEGIPEPERKPFPSPETQKQKKQKNKPKTENKPEEQKQKSPIIPDDSASVRASGLENCFIIEVPGNISGKSRQEFLNKRKDYLLKKFNSRKKCTMLINFINAENEIIDSYGLFRNLELKETIVRPANKRKLGKKKCNTYFVDYSYKIEFNKTNFLRVPTLTAYTQKKTDALPSSSLEFDYEIQLHFIGNRKENGFQVQFKISTDKPENWLENLFPMEKTLEIYTETRDNINDKPENIQYTIQQPKILKYYLGLKNDIKTEILIYLEF